MSGIRITRIRSSSKSNYTLNFTQPFKFSARFKLLHQILPRNIALESFADEQAISEHWAAMATVKTKLKAICTFQVCRMALC